MLDKTEEAAVDYVTINSTDQIDINMILFRREALNSRKDINKSLKL